MLAGRLTLTAHDEPDEDNILTLEEVFDAIEHAKKKAREHYQFKRLALGEKTESIQAKMSQIDWANEIDKDYVLKTANSNKVYDLWINKKRADERDEELKKSEELRARHTAKFFYNIMAWTSKNVYEKELIVNDNNRNLIKTICFFMSNDSRFETELGYTFKKGLLIRGISGLGKTYLFNCIKDNELSPITIYSMIEISEIVKSEGFLELPLNNGITYLDDVGTEEHTVNHFGTKINFFKNFIEKYYLNNSVYNRLILSTNNNFAEIEAKYGFRVRSRIKDMFNIIDVTGNDMRG